ncbi:MAG: penicillin-binding protein 1C [Desulfobacteraceae bacterium]|nr:penicillin-binding protein 1C [Desulfobacteraceae bacterium]
MRVRQFCSRLPVKYRIILLIVFLSVVFFWRCLPDPLFERPFSFVIEDKNGELLGASIAKDEQWRFPLKTKIPEKYEKALVCFEDKRFFSHFGVDPLALLRAGLQDLKAGSIVSGASTITMQVIRLSRQGHARTFTEKLIEMIFAIRLEISKSKKEILALFASHAPFGGNVVGIDAASWRYFGCEPNRLSWAEAAMLAVLPNSPSLIHPGRNREKLKLKRDRLLDKMKDKEIIDSLTCKLAKMELLPVKPHALPMLAPHLMNRLISDTRSNKAQNKKFSQNIRESRIRTTINKNLQKRSASVIKQHHKILSSNGIENAAALIIEVKTGDVLAYIGNVHDFKDTQHGNQVDIVTSPRSTGSILKPFLYAAMQQEGELLPSQLVFDVPIRIGGFAPKNYSKTYQGAVPAYMALARSLNVPAVRMLKSYGIDRFYAFLKRLGISTLHRSADGYGLTLILGGAEGTLWDISCVYAQMAKSLNQFFEETDYDTDKSFSKPHYLLHNPKKENNAKQYDFPLGPAASFLTFQAMLEVVRPGDESSWRNFTSSRKIAWKTGTSYGYRDGWAVGVTPEYVVGVWVGNADGEGRAGLTGASAAAPIMFELFGLLDVGVWFDKPESHLIKVNTCAKSGYRAGQYCTETKEELITLKGLQSKACPYCRIVHCDSTLSFQVHSECERVADIKPVNWFVLPAAPEYYYKRKHSDYKVLPSFRSDCLGSTANVNVRAMSIIYPEKSGKIYIPKELDGKRGKTVFELAHRETNITIFWHLDEEYMGSTREIHHMELSPDIGLHTLTLIDENGEYLSRKFTVLSKD